MKDTRIYTQLLRDYLRKYGSSPDCAAIREDTGEYLDAAGIEAFADMVTALTYEAVLHNGTWRGAVTVHLRPCMSGTRWFRVVEIHPTEPCLPPISLYVPAYVKHYQT